MKSSLITRHDDPDASDYADILKELSVLELQMVEARKNNDYKAIARVAEHISRLYAPSDGLAASRIEYLIRSIASAHYYGGIKHHIDETYARREAKFAPPF